MVAPLGRRVEDFNDITWERFIELGKIVKDRTGVSLVSTDATGPDFIMVMLREYPRFGDIESVNYSSQDDPGPLCYPADAVCGGNSGLGQMNSPAMGDDVQFVLRSACFL
jgi:hypothetical protein